MLSGTRAGTSLRRPGPVGPSAIPAIRRRRRVLPHSHAAARTLVTTVRTPGQYAPDTPTLQQDRDRFFDQSWSAIVLRLPGQDPTNISLSESFWKSCTELRSAAIGRWLIFNGLAPWPPGRPPVVALQCTGERAFSVLASDP